MKNSYKNSAQILKAVIVTSLATFSIVSASPVLASDITNENVVYLINNERTYYGLRPLKADLSLTNAAQSKSDDMLQRNYFEHFAYGLSPWSFMRNSGYNYLFAGENLAMNFQNSEDMVNAWMNSPAHRKILLSSDFEDIGIGISHGQYAKNNSTHETTIVSSMLGRRQPIIIGTIDKIVKNITSIFGQI